MHWKYTDAANSAFGDIELLANVLWPKPDYDSSGYIWLPIKKEGGEKECKKASLENCFKYVWKIKKTD